MTGYLVFLSSGVIAVVGIAAYAALKIRKCRRVAEAWRREFLSPVVEHGSPAALRREGAL